MAQIRIDRVDARDIDLLIVENIVKNPDFARTFMEDVGDAPLRLMSISLLQDDNPGEPDVTAIFETQRGRVMLLIEDNVAKTVSKDSQARIKEIGRRGIKEGRCDGYRCCLLAPGNFLDANAEELEGFPVVTYETLREALSGDAWGEFLMNRAVAERPVAFSAKTNERVIEFWGKYYKYVRRVFPDLSMKRFNEVTGFQSTTVQFTTRVPGVCIYHKSREGVVDVMVKLKNHSYARFEGSMVPYLFEDIYIRPNGRDAMFCIDVPVIDFSDDFDAQQTNLDGVLEAVVEMQEFMQELDYGRMERILQEGPAVE